MFDLGTASLADYGFPHLSIHRGDLQSVLSTAVTERDPHAIRRGAEIVDVETRHDGAVVVLANGEKLAADIVVGADGIHSGVRAKIFGAGPATFTGCIAWRGVIPSDRLPSHFQRDIGVNWVGPGRHVVTYPLRRGEFVELRRGRRTRWMGNGILGGQRHA